jgi:hypothetical protein
VIGLKRALAAALAAAVALTLAACGGDDDDGSSDSSSEGGTTTQEVIVQAGNGDFNPAEVYEKASPGVVTVLARVRDRASSSPTRARS